MTMLVVSCLINCDGHVSDDGFIYNLALEILAFYQQFDNEIIDFSNFHKQYNHEMAKCIPSAFIRNYNQIKNQINLKPLPLLKF
jgi:hypothetical protein